MAYTCDLTGKRKLRGNRVSHANNKTPHFQLPNLHVKTFAIPELNLRVRLRVSRTAIRTVDKVGGLSAYLRRTPEDNLIPRLRQIKKSLAGRQFKAVSIV